MHCDPSEWQIIPNTQEAIIDEDTFATVQELRSSRRRTTATGRTSLFSGLVFCGDCHSKLYFCAAKSLKPNQEYYRCSAYKENRGICSIHFIRNVVLEELVLTTIRKVARYICEYEPVFLYLYAKQHELARTNDLNEAKRKTEQSKKRIADIDKLIEAVFEQHILGKLPEERFQKMRSDYETEQKQLTEFVTETEKKIEDAKQEKIDLRVFLDEIRKCTEITELTPTLVNTLIKRIEVFDSILDEDGKKHVPVKIYFRAAGIITIPDENEILSVYEDIQNKPIKTA